MIQNSHTSANHLLLDFMVQSKITEADTPTVQLGATPSKLVSDPPPSSPHFNAGCPSAPTLPIYPCLGQAQEYAGLHTAGAIEQQPKFISI